MKSCSFVTLASAALAALRLQATDASEAKGPTITGTVTSVDCLTQFNEARAVAGLPAFTNGTDDYKADLKNGSFTTEVCTALINQTPIKPTETYDRTIALAAQDGEEGDCAAAVTHFNGALSLFGSLPPAFSTTEKVYKNLQAVSFVALYNPKENPKLACGYFICKSTPQSSDGTAGVGGVPGVVPGVGVGGVPGAAGAAAALPSASGESSSTETTFRGLLCASGPQALLEGKAPFEQEQYDKIKSAISSASAAVPAFATLAVAAAGLLLL